MQTNLLSKAKTDMLVTTQHRHKFFLSSGRVVDIFTFQIQYRYILSIISRKLV